MNPTAASGVAIVIHYRNSRGLYAIEYGTELRSLDHQLATVDSVLGIYDVARLVFDNSVS